jgi:fatty acid oxidation complex alpha subunit
MDNKNSNLIHTDVFDHIAICTLDIPGDKVNTLGSRLTEEFDSLLNFIEEKNEIFGAIIISGKEDNFIAGANIEELKNAASKDDVIQLSQTGHRLLNRLSELKKPIVAAINGSCLGGGLELALACHYRVATDDKKTVLGLPEVMLGLLPGAGGTQRLPRLIGVQKALDLLLTGKTVNAPKALKLGIIDHVCPKAALKHIAVNACHALAKGHLQRKEKKLSAQDMALEGTMAGKALLFSKAKQMIMKKTLGLYPAPLKILEVVKLGLDHGSKRGGEAEIKAFGELSQTPQSRSLISLFDGQTSLKKNRFGKVEKPIKEIGIIGAGLMGAGIGLVTIQKGMRARIKDLSEESLGRGFLYINDELKRKVRSKSITLFDKNKTMSNLTLQKDFAHFKDCSIVIEAVFEDLELKKRVLREVEEHMSPDTVFASNTSGLPITKIAEASKRPENVVGMHYFSPVHKMPLLEVVLTEKTSPQTAAMAVQVGLKQGKTVICVKDGPGFYTTRILGPYLDESVILALEGLELPALDKAMKEFGFPVGPVTLLDEVGIDVGAHVAKDLKAAFGERIAAGDVSVLDKIIAKGILGRKSHKGMYLYEEDNAGAKKDFFSHLNLSLLGMKREKTVNPEVLAVLQEMKREGKHSHAKKDIQQRIVLRMINEAVYCLQENILENPIDGDIGAVFGLGFPPIFGGPFRYIDTVGADIIVGLLKRYQDEMGDRFKPAPLLEEMAKEGRLFLGK